MAQPQSACARQHGQSLYLRQATGQISQRSENRRVQQVPLLAMQEPQARETADRARPPRSDLVPGVEKRTRISNCTEEKTMNAFALRGSSDMTMTDSYPERHFRKLSLGRLPAPSFRREPPTSRRSMLHCQSVCAGTEAGTLPAQAEVVAAGRIPAPHQEQGALGMVHDPFSSASRRAISRSKIDVVGM